MTSRSVAHSSRPQLFASLVLALVVLLPTAAARADDFALDCDVVAGILSVRLSSPERVGVWGRALDERTWVYEIDDPSLMGLEPGAMSCVSVQSIRVLPGYLLGTRGSRIVITHDGPAPRSHSQSGRHRLLWLPEPAPAAARVAPELKGRPREEAPAPRVDQAQSRSADVKPGQLEAEVRAQREETARLRERLDAEAATREPPPPRETERERKQAARAEKEAQRLAEREAEFARREAQRAVPMRSPPPEPEPVAPPEPPRVVASQPAHPAPTPRALPEDYTAFASPATLLVTVPADLKDGPGRRFRTLRRLGAGERVAVSGRAGDWYRVGAGEGWAFATYLESFASADASSSHLGVVQEVTVPVHEGPGGQHAVVAELYRGQQVVVDELKDEWAHVRNGGWVRRNALGVLTPGQGSSR